jgi:hypothetical protein
MDIGEEDREAAREAMDVVDLGCRRVSGASPAHEGRSTHPLIAEAQQHPRRVILQRERKHDWQLRQRDPTRAELQDRKEAKLASAQLHTA